jgi:TPR repeat protein
MKQQLTKSHARHQTLPALPRLLYQLLLSLVLLGNTPLASAGICDRTWDAEKVMQVAQANNLDYGLQFKNQTGTETVETLTVAQFQAFYEANEAIAKVTGLTPTFVVCDSKEPNAFAMGTNQGLVVGVTLGLFKVVDGDRDMAAEVLGHEYTHHIKGHRAMAQTRNEVLNLLGMIAGIALETRFQQRYHVANVGTDMAVVSTGLLISKFDRDQEREADAEGLKYMVKAGFSPAGAIRLTEKMDKIGGGSGLFFADHPGWGERTERLKTLIAQSPEAQQNLASLGEYTKLAMSDRQQMAKDLQVAALQPTYQSTDAEKSFNDAVGACARKDYAECLRHIRAAAGAGHAQSQAVLGYLYATGMVGLPKDEKEAVRLFRLSADQGNALGQNNLGYAYSIGYVVPKDYDEAIRLLRLSTEQGNPLAEVNLGFMYQNGTGIKQDMAEAARLYKLAVDQGNVIAKNNLGLMLINGWGVAQDLNAGIALLREAAAQGQPNALGTLQQPGQ